MLMSAFPLLIAGAVMVCLPLLPPELLTQALGAGYADTVTRAFLGVGILLLIVELASGAAGVVSLAAREKVMPHNILDTGVPEAGVESFAQKYAARLKNDGGLESANRAESS